MKLQGHSWIRRGALLVALTSVAAWAVGTARRLQDIAEVAAMTAHMKTVCAGRFLVQVPAEAEVSFSGVMVGGFDVDAREESEAAFEKRVAARELELKTHSESNGSKSLNGSMESRELHIPNMLGRILTFGKTHTHRFEDGREVSSEYVSVETHAHTLGFSILLSMQYADDADIGLSEDLLSRLHIAGKDKAPATPGFCLGHFAFADPLPAQGGEQLEMRLDFPGHADLSMALISIAGAKTGPGILSRTARVDSEARTEELLRVTKLRAGKRTINGLNGEEVLERVREYNFTSTYGFNWEARGSGAGPLQPYLSLELQAGISERPGGKPVATSLHKDALLSLWDSISSSLRVRKTVTDPPEPRSSSAALATH